MSDKQREVLVRTGPRHDIDDVLFLIKPPDSTKVNKEQKKKTKQCSPQQQAQSSYM